MWLSLRKEKEGFAMNEHPRILVVEDENIIAMDIRHTLKGFGYEVCGVVSSGEESIERAFQNHPDLVLMDIKLRGTIDGICAAKKIQSQMNVPVIYLTAYGDESTLNRVDKTKPYGYIHKPFHESELRFKIESALNISGNVLLN